VNQVCTVPGRYGTIAYWANDYVIGRIVSTYGEWYEREVDIFRLYCGRNDTCVDVGANIGTHTLALANIVGPKGRVVSIEPQRPMFMLMCANAVMNGYLQVEPFRAVAGKACHRMNYAVVRYDEGNSFGGYDTRLQAAMAPGHVNEALETVTIDYLSCYKAKLIKIDVEGSECNVIWGAEKTLKLARPVLYVENDRVENSKELIIALRALDYKLYWHLPASFNPDNFAGSKEILHEVGMVYTRGQYWVNGLAVNLLCLPDGKELPLPPDVLEVGNDDEHPCLPKDRQRLVPNLKELIDANDVARVE